MKKLLVVLLALVVIGSFASAQVTFGSWNRIGYSLYSGNANNGSSAVYPNWSRADFALQVIKDNAGIIANLELKPDGSLGTGDSIEAYVNVLDGMIKLHVGKAYGDALRGKIGGSQAVGTTQAGDEDALFTRFKMNQGLFLELKPVEGLFIGAVVNAAATLADEFSAIQVGAGYTIKDIGQFRVGYVGDVATAPVFTAAKDAADAVAPTVVAGVYIPGKDAVKKADASIAGAGEYVQAAFAFTGVAGLTADLGAKFYIDPETSNQNNITVAAKYGAGAFNAMARAQLSLALAATRAVFNKDLNVAAGANVNYAVMDTIVVGADLGLNSILATGKVMNATPYVQYNIPGGGQLQIGFNMAIALDGTAPIGFQIPIVLTI